MWRSIVSTAVAICALGSAQTTSAAKQTEANPTQTLFAHAQYGAPILSPNGQMVSVLIPVNDRQALAVIDLATRNARVLASSKLWDVAGVRWINNERLLFYVQDTRDVLERTKGAGPYAVNTDGSGFRDLSEKMRISVQATLKDGSADILVTSKKRSPDAGKDDFGSSDVYRMDTLTGRVKLLTFKNPGKVASWITDDHGHVRAAVSWFGDKAAGKLRYVTRYRDHNDADWKVISDFIADEQGYLPVAIDGDGQTLLVRGRGGEDTEGLYEWDFASNQPRRLLFRHPRADFEGGLLRDYDSGKVVGVTVDPGKLESHYFDDTWAKRQADFDATFPGAVNRLQKRGNTLLAVTWSDVNPGEAFLYDSKTGGLERFLAFMPDIKTDQLSPMAVVSYTARDGLEIPAYLTLPKGLPERGLPLVVFVHGGPHARDNWGFQPTVQFLAGKGYAVLQSNFRMSTGLGWKLHRKGWKQWGLAMQDDLTDGVRWLVQRGIVDPKRVCIMGASYGGYAAMYGLIKDPELYQCGINYVGVTDISLLYTVAWSDTAGSVWERFRQKDMHGDPDVDVEYMKRSSVIGNAERIVKPVLMAYGSEDVRVPPIHGEKLMTKLNEQKIPVEWIVYAGEGHGWSKQENKADFAERVGRFLDKHIGPGATSSRSSTQ